MRFYCAATAAEAALVVGGVIASGTNEKAEVVLCDWKPSHFRKPLAESCVFFFFFVFFCVCVRVRVVCVCVVFTLMNLATSLQYAFSSASCHWCLSCERRPPAFFLRVCVCVCREARWREKCTVCTFLTSTFMLMISLFTLRLPGNIFLILYFTVLPAVWLNWPGGAKGKEVKRGEAAGFTALLGRRRQVEELWRQAGGTEGPAGALH